MTDGGDFEHGTLVYLAASTVQIREGSFPWVGKQKGTGRGYEFAKVVPVVDGVYLPCVTP